MDRPRNVPEAAFWLSKYELSSAMASQAKTPPEPLTMAQSTELLVQAKNKMPWQG